MINPDASGLCQTWKFVKLPEGRGRGCGPNGGRPVGRQNEEEKEPERRHPLGVLR